MARSSTLSINMMYIFYNITLPMVIRGQTDQASKTRASTLKIPFASYQHLFFDSNAQIAVFRINTIASVNIVLVGGSYWAKGDIQFQSIL
jgi:hypothetical protein